MFAFKNMLIMFSCFVFLSFQLEGRHIIGGDMFYDCIGPGQYEVTIVLYRDCAGGGAFFDSSPFSATVGTVSIYRSDRDTPFAGIILDEPEISDVDISSSNPCLIIPPSLCVEKGVYKFDVALPVSEHTYTISYQRCCRNNTINNITNPDETGATYTIDILPEAQDNCNPSLRFNNFPPFVICERDPLEFDHSAFDPLDREGITLEYSFCTPYVGGGLAGSPGNPGSPTGPDGVAPDPDLPPPYDEVNFVGGEFSAETPMGGDPVISIDSQTGLISGTPIVQGQYVIGVCATAIDSSGNVVDVIRRDFQFNVADCEPSVTASISADSIDDSGNFVINACGKDEVQFNDESFQEEFIDTRDWSFDMGIEGDSEFSGQNPLVTFPAQGQYTGQIILNKGRSCSDTGNILINIWGAIENDFSYEYDTCVYGPVMFEGESMTGNNEIVTREWVVTGEGSAQGSTASYLFARAGNKRVSYRVVDDIGCEAITQKIIPYYPIPNEIIVDPIPNSVCEPVEVFFDNQSFPLSNEYDIFWEFGDGGTSREISPTHLYEQPGTYEISLSIESPIGCEYFGVLDQEIEVRERPIADFTFEPSDLTQRNSTAFFTDRSFAPNEWYWNFDDIGNSIDQNPSFDFPDTGRYQIVLEVTHANGCRDSIAKILDVVPKPTYFLPNAFRPQSGGTNSTYRGQGDFIGISDFQLQIFNRWGGIVFETDDPYEGWNGREKNVGPTMPAGVYVCRVTYTGPRGNQFELKEFATLIK